MQFVGNLKHSQFLQQNIVWQSSIAVPVISVYRAVPLWTKRNHIALNCLAFLYRFDPRPCSNGIRRNWKLFEVVRWNTTIAATTIFLSPEYICKISRNTIFVYSFERELDVASRRFSYSQQPRSQFLEKIQDSWFSHHKTSCKKWISRWPLM